MLPPFRVRDLRRSISSSSRPSPSNLGVILDDYPLLRITAPQYDSTISDYPDAKLRYFDDDDGEIVTVGTSLELSQRLEEPPPQCSHPQQGHHIFDVDQKETSAKVWQSLAEQGSKINSAVGRTEPESGHGLLDQGRLRLLGQGTSETPTPTSVLRDVVSDGPTTSSAENYCKQYIEACNPPRLIPPQDAGRAPLGNFNAAKHTSRAISKRSNNPATNDLLIGATSLTAEGQRQAQAAGDRMRASRYSRRTTAVTEASPRANYQNRWATYNSSNPSFYVANHTNHVEPFVNSSSRQAQAAGDKIRDRSSRITQSQSKSNDCGQEEIKSSSFTHNDPRSLHFDVQSNHAISTSRLPAADSPKTPKNNVKSENLLEVFESEFSKDIKHVESMGSTPKLSPPSSNVPISATQLGAATLRLKAPLDEQDSGNLRMKMLSPNAPPNQQNSRSIKQLVDDIASVILHIRTQGSSSEESLLTQQVCSALEKALDSALYELETCLKEITKSAKDAIKLAIPESLDHHKQQFENPSETSEYPPQKASSSAQPISDAQFSAAERSEGRPCKQPGAMLHALQDGEATNSGSDVNGSSSCNYKPRGSALSSFIASKGVPPRSDRKPMEYETVTDSNTRTHLQEQKVAQSLGTSLPSTCELPTIRNGTPIKYNSNLDMPLSSNFTPDNDKSAKPIEPHQTKTQAGGSRIQPSMSEKKSLLIAQNARDIRGYNIPKINTLTSHDVTKPLRSRSPLSKQPTHYNPKPLAIHGEGAQPLITELVSHRGTTYRDELRGYTLRRMTGPSADPSCSHTSEESTFYHEPQGRLGGLRRSATVASLNDKYTTSSRRPYSTNFEGSYRTRLASSPHQRALHVEESAVKNIRPVGNRPESLQVRAQNHVPESFSQDTYAAEHADMTTASKVQECVEQLQKLGFGSDAEGSVQRLVIYAQAADGDLIEAIDMIDEERRAYRQRY